MKITILTVGSRGDVQPYIALGLGLREAGHEVTIGTGKGFETMVTERGLHYALLSADYIEMVERPEVRASLEGGRGSLQLMREVMPMLRQTLDDAWVAAQGSDAIVHHPKALGGYHIAEKLGIPAFLAMALPAYSPTHAFPNPMLPFATLGGFLNKATYSLTTRLATAPYQKLINRWRRDVLDLPSRSFMAGELQLRGASVQRVYAYSPHILPTPDDWDSSSVATGYWFLDRLDGWQPPTELVDFLQAGPPPIYIGFGSMAGRNPEKTTRIVLDALRHSEQRGIVATGWGGLSASELPHNVFQIESVPHDWLFPQVAAVVHHGGAGTTGAGLRAGKPTVICPFFGDQPFWGQRVWALGAGPKPIPQKKLTAEKLAEAIRVATTDEAMRQLAASLGEKIRAEDGVACAVEIINARLTNETSHRREEMSLAVS